MLTLLACTTSTPSDSTPEADLEHLWSFVVFADPHITLEPDRAQRLTAAVDWVNQNRAAHAIDLVVIVGDIGWGEGLPLSKELLDGLEVPYLPVMGDNEVHFGDEENFEAVYGAHIAALPVEDLTRGTVEVWNPEHEQTSWFQNTSFHFQGTRVVGLDWNSRSEDGILGEFADIHDFEGGTLPFLGASLALEAGPFEDTLLFSHHPMHVGMFDAKEMEALGEIIGPVGDRVAGAWAGHVHQDATIEVPELGYTAWVTDAIWDDTNTVRLVEVHGNGARFAFEQDLITVD